MVLMIPNDPTIPPFRGRGGRRFGGDTFALGGRRQARDDRQSGPPKKPWEKLWERHERLGISFFVSMFFLTEINKL